MTVVIDAESTRVLASGDLEGHFAGAQNDSMGEQQTMMCNLLERPGSLIQSVVEIRGGHVAACNISI